MPDSLEIFSPPFSPVQKRIRRFTAAPSLNEWARHAALFALTAISTTLAGVFLAVPGDLPAPVIPAPVHLAAYLVNPLRYYLAYTGNMANYALSHPDVLLAGCLFSGSLLLILLAHEAGHYVACRMYGVRSTLPFFLPAPPPFPAGTFGAFIKIKSPIPSRRALFDIGVAGPLAGFAVIILISALALLTPHPSLQPSEGPQIIFNDPLLLQLMARIMRVQLGASDAGTPFYFAAWFGLLVTSLNLLPVSQLDGGHAVFAVFGQRFHKISGRAAFVIVCVLAPIGWFRHGVPSGFVYALVLLVMLRIRHPPVYDEGELGRGRRIVALATLLVFILSFLPFPLTIT